MDLATARAPELVTAEHPQAPLLVHLAGVVSDFLDLYGEESVVGAGFRSIIGEGDGETRFARLAGVAGYPDDPDGFLGEVVRRLESASAGAEVAVGGVSLPQPLLLAMLEVLVPGNGIVDIKSVSRLEKLTNRVVPAADRSEIQEVLRRYPVRLSMHTVRQIRLSPAIAWQYLPFVEELEHWGLVHTWVGQFHRGVLEQMYQNRVIMVLNMSCPVYCRFCFRKHKECRTQKAPTQRHVNEAICHIRGNQQIKEVVLTGGDPFMNRPTLTRAVDGLRDIPHIQTLRLATRSLSYYPALFTTRDGFWMSYLKRKQLELQERGKRLEIATHFIHPDEASVHSLELIAELVGSGIAVYVQTPFLGGCNDRGPELAELYRKLRGVGAEMHYIFMPCSPLQGNGRYQAPLAAGLAAASYLRGHLSDRAMPHICTATAIGKIDWGSNGWAVEVDDRDSSFLWLRTPYTREYFESFAPMLDLSEVARPNFEGTMDARFKAEIGDRRWLVGAQRPPAADAAAQPENDPPAADELEQVWQAVHRESGPGLEIAASGSPALSRVHLTRVELECDADDIAVERALREIEADESISDLVLWSRRDPLRRLKRVEHIVERMARVPHVTAVRLRSLLLGAVPEAVPEGTLRRLASLNRLSVINPTRLEVEVQLLRACDIHPAMAQAVRTLRGRGVAVYCNIPLLAGINDSGEELLRLAFECRRLGIEVHHCYIAGLSQQQQWSARHPISLARVIDIASHLRRYGSGRELPRYVVRTALGEVDLGLSAETLDTGQPGPAHQLRMRLLTYSVDELRDLLPRLTLPAGVEVDEDGHPIVVVPGLTR